MTYYKGQDMRAIADSLAELSIGQAAPDQRMRMLERKSKQIMVKIAEEVLKDTDLDLIGFIQEFVATNVTIKSEKKYKIKTNMVKNLELYETEVYYDFDFWNNFQLPDKSKFLQEIKANLEEAGNGKPLDQQFDEVGRKNNEKNKQFSKRMKKEKEEKKKSNKS